MIGMFVFVMLKQVKRIIICGVNVSELLFLLHFVVFLYLKIFLVLIEINRLFCRFLIRTQLVIDEF